MITILVSSQKIIDQSADGFGFLLPEKGVSSADLKACEKEFGISISDFLKKHDFTGKLMQTFAVPVMKKNKLYHIICVGLGSKKDTTIENYRRALAHLYRQAAAHKAKVLAISMPAASLFDTSVEELGQQTATILDMAAYQFDTFFSKENRKKTELSKPMRSTNPFARTSPS